MTFKVVKDILASVYLTPRESQVLGLIALGNTAKEIARVLNISVHTVRTHRDKLRVKTGAHNVAQLAYYHAAMTMGTMAEALPMSPMELKNGVHPFMPTKAAPAPAIPPLEVKSPVHPFRPSTAPAA